jgi:hypothetical protein
MPKGAKTMRVVVSKSFLEMSRSMFPLFFKRKRTMVRLSEVDRDGVIFGFVAVIGVFSHCAIEAFVNAQIMKLGNISNSRKKRTIRNESIVKKIEFLCVSLGIPKIENCDPALWRDFKDITKKVRNFFIHPKPWEFHPTLQEITEQIPIGKYVEVASKIIGHFYEKTGARKPAWLGRKNTVFQFTDFKVIP